jgi:hypothetical protein
MYIPRFLFGALLATACSTGANPSAVGKEKGSASGTDAGADHDTAKASGGEKPDAGEPYTETACPGAPTSPGITSSFPSCSAVCGAPSHCIPTSLAMGEGDFLADCPNDGSGLPGKCVPDQIGATLGKFVFKTCKFFLDNSEGRCVPKCIAARESQSADLLSRDVCGAEELCAPCSDPTNGNASTHACDNYCGTAAASDAGG